MKKFKDLSIGFIVGIIDSYGAVHSRFDDDCNVQFLELD
jgi:hypothetical protein